MFDNTPANLPVEPTPAAPSGSPNPPPFIPAPPTEASPAPTPANPVMISSAPKSEPEDMFAGMDTGANSAPMKATETFASSYEPAPDHRGAKIAAAAIIGLLLAGGIGATAYYILVYQPAQKEEAAFNALQQQETAAKTAGDGEGVTAGIAGETTTPPTSVPIPTPEPTPIEVTETATPTLETPSLETPTPPPVAPANIPPPTVIDQPAPTLPQEGPDEDRDGLTDTEEAIYGTSPVSIDTDTDQFGDGNEVRNGYDPAKAGTMLNASAQLQTITWQVWKVLLPKSWNLEPDATNPYQATVQTGSSASIQLQSMANGKRLSAQQWVDEKGLGDRARAFELPGKRQAVQSQDGLTTYIAFGDRVLVLTYQIQDALSYDFRTTYAMVAAMVMDTR